MKPKEESVRMSFDKTKEATQLQLELAKIREHLAKVKEENYSKSQKLGRLRNEASYYATLAYDAVDAQEYKEKFLAIEKKKNKKVK